MALMEWNEEEYGTGVEFADNEHKTIFSFLNGVDEAAGAGDQEKARKIMADLTDYTARHFESEECAMVRKGYENVVIHKLSHFKFVTMLLEIQTSSDDITQEATLNAKEWFTKHIQNEDRLYEKTLNA